MFLGIPHDRVVVEVVKLLEWAKSVGRRLERDGFSVFEDALSGALTDNQ